mmetsp:Transcript_35632/g.83273  ORF Transcript_35632/g.83273 Transcript_35632/m.83273 type:complete len:221 (+) Transcript_35632:77-739(+)
MSQLLMPCWSIFSPNWSSPRTAKSGFGSLVERGVPLPFPPPLLNPCPPPGIGNPAPPALGRDWGTERDWPVFCGVYCAALSDCRSWVACGESDARDAGGAGLAPCAVKVCPAGGGPLAKVAPAGPAGDGAMARVSESMACIRCLRRATCAARSASVCCSALWSCIGGICHPGTLAVAGSLRRHGASWRDRAWVLSSRGGELRERGAGAWGRTERRPAQSS